MSAAEVSAAIILAALNIVPCNTFAPHFPEHFTDKKGHTRKHLPDFATAFVHANGKPLFIEYKDNILNSKTSFESAKNAIYSQYEWRYGQTPPSYDHAASVLWGEGKGKFRNDVLKHGYNHALSKQLITQEVIGRENFVVVFADKLFTAANEAIFTNYSKKGLHYTKLSEVEAYITPS